MIPQGHYGAGPVLIWDSGAFQAEGYPETALKKGKLNFSLNGKKLIEKTHRVKPAKSR